MAKVFVLEGPDAGKTVQYLGRYTFIDGVMVEEDDDTAKMKAAVLCTLYPAKMIDHAEYLRMTTTKSEPPKPAQKAELATKA